MVNVIEELNIQHFQERESKADLLPTYEHWQTRGRKLKNRKWRELNRKIMNDSRITN